MIAIQLYGCVIYLEANLLFWRENMKKRIVKIFAFILAMIFLFSACSSSAPVSTSTEGYKTNYKYVFVHGLSGWGSYDFQNKFIKYWGMMNGDMLGTLNKEGFECYAASVDPKGSAWDRACELYAQLTGTVVDYGQEHSTRCNHERYGEDYSDKPLIDSWSSEDKINLLGHSFGGATVRMLATLMAQGSEAEMESSSDTISPLFTGGKGDWIYSITALAAPHNGTSAYESNDGKPEDITKKQKFMSDMVNGATKKEETGKADFDYADYDLRIDNALKLNEILTTVDGIYYFSIPCSCTIKDSDGKYIPNQDITEDMFVNSAIKMGKFTGTTNDGFEVTDEWLDNDGLVNTISATAPFNARAEQYNGQKVEKGIWYIMDTYEGDHMSLQGDIFLKRDVTDLYRDLLKMINEI